MFVLWYPVPFMSLWRWPVLVLKYGLAVFGAYLLIALYVDRWGVAAGLWFLGAPLVFGLVRGLMAYRQSSTPAPR